MNLLSTVEFPNLFSGDITVNRVAFNLFGIDVYWYGILIGLGVVLAFIYCMKKAKDVGITKDDIFDVGFWGAIGGFIGARAYFVIFFNLDSANEVKYTLWTAITGVRDGGLAIYGGIIGGVLVGVIAAKIKKVNILPIMDLAGIGFLMGQGLGRWGNFFNQECFGSPTANNLPWGMTGTGIVASAEYQNAIEALGLKTDALVHPCFLYESLWCGIGILALHFYLKKLRSFDGEVFLLYVVWYGLGRAWIEGLRTDSLYAGSLKISQVVGLASAIFALILFIYFKLTLTKKRGYVIYSKRPATVERLEKYSKGLRVEKEAEAAKKALKKSEKLKDEPVAPSILADDTAEKQEEAVEAKEEEKSEVKEEEKEDGKAD